MSLEDLRAALGASEPEFDGDSYNGFKVIPAPASMPEAHRVHPGRFYVLSPRGTIGFVPWAGSQIIWPWEAAFVQDLSKPEVREYLRAERKKKRR